MESLLGKGGMGFVVAARHVQLEQQLAIKFMRPEALEAEGARARFEREARAAVKLRSEHVARVLDVGLLDSGPHAGSPYIVMEYLEGSNLRALLKQRQRFGCDEAATYIMQACEAVAEAHALGMVHRDIKPTNLFLTYTPTGRPCVKVLDFGIVKTLEPVDGSVEETLTKTQAALGSPRYMAPEQVASAKKVDRRSDVWALGACLYQFVTGKPAFQGENLLELGAKIVHEDPEDPRIARPDLPPALASIILCCLDKSPERRFADARQLGIALEQYLSPPVARPSGAHTSSPIEVAARSSSNIPISQPPQSQPMPSIPVRAEDTGPTGGSQYPSKVAWEGTGGSQKPPRSKLPLAFAILTVFAFIGVGLGGLALWARHSHAPPEKTASTPAAPPPPTSALPTEAPPPSATSEPSPRVETPPTPPVEASATPAASPIASSAPRATARPSKPAAPPSPPQAKPASSRAFDHL